MQQQSDEFKRRGYLTALGALAVAWTILSFPWLSGDVTIPYDAKAYFQAQIQFLAHALHTGQSPFWSHNVFGGTPQIADPQSLIFSPALLLAYAEAVPSFRQMDVYVLALLGIGALSILMFFRDRGWHPAGGVLAALTMAFGASAAWRIQHIIQVQAFVLFAIALWLLARAIDRRSLPYGLVAGFFIGLMLMGPGQVSLLGSYLLAGYVLHYWASSENRRKALTDSLPTLSVAGATSLLLAGGPILLTYLFVESSSRPEIAFDEAVRGSLHPASLFTGLVADLFGAVNPSVPYWGPGSSDWTADRLTLSENMGQMYMGALPIVAVLGLGLTRGILWARDIRFFTIGLIMMLAYALGRYTPLFQVFYDYFPGVDMFRRPADATFEVGAMLAIVAGYTVHRLLSDPMPKLALWRRIAPYAIFTAAFAACFLIARYHNAVGIAWKPIVSSLCFTAGAVALLAYFIRNAAPRWQMATVLLALFMTVDLSVNNGPNGSTGRAPAEYDVLCPDSTNETLRFLKAHLRQPDQSVRRDRVELVGLGFAWPNASLVHDFDHALGYNPLRLAEASAAGFSEGVGEPQQRIFTPLYPSYRSRTADLLGVRYIASPIPIERVDKKLQPGDLGLVTRTKDGYVYENPRALPRVLFATSWQKASFAKISKDGGWPDFDPTKTVLLDGYKGAPMQPSAKGVAKLRMLHYENTVIEVEVDSPNAGFVVLNDMWHPWWYVSVDGQEAEMRKANVLFRAVRVTEGKHIVRFEFKPFAGAIAQLSNTMSASE